MTPLQSIQQRGREDFELARDTFTEYDTSLFTRVVDDEKVIAFLETYIVIAWDAALKAVEEKIREAGHQQEDDTIWCDMDEILSALTSLKSSAQ